jgi:hypothetical protein
MLCNFLEPKLNECENPAVWFQQDGATAHVARGSMTILWEMFPGRLISLQGDIPWPARSPNLAACDFFLWGYLKAEVYKRRPRTTDKLKAGIQHEIAAVPLQMTRWVMRNFRVRLQICIGNESRRLEDIIFKERWKVGKHCSFRLSNNNLKMVNIVLSDCEIKLWIA